MAASFSHFPRWPPFWSWESLFLVWQPNKRLCIHNNSDINTSPTKLYSLWDHQSNWIRHSSQNFQNEAVEAILDLNMAAILDFSIFHNFAAIYHKIMHNTSNHIFFRSRNPKIMTQLMYGQSKMSYRQPSWIFIMTTIFNLITFITAVGQWLSDVLGNHADAS